MGGNGGDRGERGEGDKDFQQTVAMVVSEACRASRARRTRGALRCEIATVLLKEYFTARYIDARVSSILSRCDLKEGKCCVKNNPNANLCSMLGLSG